MVKTPSTNLQGMQLHSLSWKDSFPTFPGDGNGNSCLGNPVDRRAWRATVSPWGHKRVRHDLATKHQIVDL